MVAWLTAKSVAIFFGIATTAFCIATIVLAVEKADLEHDLQDALDKLDALAADTTTANPNTSQSTSDGGTTPDGETSSNGGNTEDGGTTPSDGTTPDGGTTPTGGGTADGGTTPSGGTTPDGGTTPSSGTTPDGGLVTIYPTLPTGLPNVDEIEWRIPNELVPIRYRLYMHPNMTSGVIDGTVSIQVQAEKVTNLIVLHCKDIEIETISILNMMARMRIAVKGYTVDPIRELLIIELREVLSTEKAYTVSISFRSKLTGLAGAYTSSYSEGLIATTKFEPTFAREAFPCFDEPALKAQFTITIARPSGDAYHALSNMPIESETVVGNLTEVTFQETMPMSTYLAAFVVSDFAYEETNVGETDIKLRVYAQPAQIAKTQYALDVGASITAHYIDYFNISYPLPKLDMVAIPDFVSGAMENWGLITYRETALLYDKDVSSAGNKQNVASVIAHELAHQWFGNLVTMEWWNDLWLNEGFATFVSYKGIKHVEDNWDIDNQFVVETLQPVMKIDATLASHPIVRAIESPAQITENFDTITYSKGASLVRMLEHLVGELKFKNGTQNYLYNHVYSCATTEDFLTAIEEQVPEIEVKLIMQTWTEQMGLPVVNVEQNGNTYKLTQKRFLSNPDDYDNEFEPSSFNYRWSIPITYTSSASSEEQRTIFQHTDNEASITLASEASWIKFNKDQVGYYIVNYAAEQWTALTTALKESRASFSTADRAGLLFDAHTLAGAGQLDYSHAMDLASYLENELDFVPWSVGTHLLNDLKQQLYYTDLFKNYSIYARTQLSKVVESVGYIVGEDHLQNRLRIIVLNAAASVGHESAMQQAVTLFNAWLAEPETRPSPDLRTFVYYYGLQQVSSEAAWDQVWALYLKETDAQEKEKLMSALASVKQPWLLQRYINLAGDESNVRGQDYFNCLRYISENPSGRSLVWDHVRENWPTLVERFGINERNLGRMVTSVTRTFNTQTKLEEMESFFAKYPEAGAGTESRKAALEYVKGNIKWLQQNKESIGQWLADFVDQQTVTNRIE